MKSDTKQAKGSSLLVSWVCLGLLGLGVFLCLRLDAAVPGGVCLFFLLLGLACRYWSRRATEDLSLRMECRKTRLFPDQETSMEFVDQQRKQCFDIALVFDKEVRSIGHSLQKATDLLVIRPGQEADAAISEIFIPVRHDAVVISRFDIMDLTF